MVSAGGADMATSVNTKNRVQPITQTVDVTANISDIAFIFMAILPRVNIYVCAKKDALSFSFYIIYRSTRMSSPSTFTG